MVEMTEVANILRNATAKSLLILDEIGRGTSTFDGLAIAWAVIEHISNTKLCGAKTLFATHYHELTELEGKLSGVTNYCIAVKEKGDDIVFLRKIVKGGADKSYGIQVAKLAGVPDSVINRAKELVEELSDADTVSYTHLFNTKGDQLYIKDKYNFSFTADPKILERDTKEVFIDQFIQLDEKQTVTISKAKYNLFSCTPVSYTHLDVYKRQVTLYEEKIIFI